MNKALRKLSIPRLLVNAAFVLLSLGCLYPVLWVGYTSVKSLKEYNVSIVSFPAHPTVANYVQILRNAKFIDYFFNSAFISLATLAVTLVLAYLTGYFLSRFKFRGRNLLYGFFMFGIVVPTHAWLLPVFAQFKSLGLYDRRITLLLPYVAFCCLTWPSPCRRPYSCSRVSCGRYRSKWKNPR